MDDELELGLAPSTKRKRTVAGSARAKRSWKLYKVKSPRLCDVCVIEVPKVDGWPIHAVNGAIYVEHGPDGNMYLCIVHKEQRESVFREV